MILVEIIFLDSVWSLHTNQKTILDHSSFGNVLCWYYLLLFDNADCEQSSFYFKKPFYQLHSFLTTFVINDLGIFDVSF